MDASNSSSDLGSAISEQIKLMRQAFHRLISDLVHWSVDIHMVRSWFDNGVIWILLGSVILLIVLLKGLMGQSDVQVTKSVSEDEDFDFLNSCEGVQSKIHLAGAFARIGKHEEAKKLYLEIIGKGNRDQVKVAKFQLKELND